MRQARIALFCITAAASFLVSTGQQTTSSLGWEESFECMECISDAGCSYCLDDSSNSTSVTNNFTASFALQSYVCACDGAEQTLSGCLTTTETCGQTDFGETFGDLLGFAAWLFILLLVCCCLCTVAGIIGCVCCCCPPEQRLGRNQHGAYVSGGTKPVTATAVVAAQGEPPLAAAVVVAQPDIEAETGLTPK